MKKIMSALLLTLSTMSFAHELNLDILGDYQLILNESDKGCAKTLDISIIEDEKNGETLKLNFHSWHGKKLIYDIGKRESYIIPSRSHGEHTIGHMSSTISDNGNKIEARFLEAQSIGMALPIPANGTKGSYSLQLDAGEFLTYKYSLQHRTIDNNKLNQSLICEYQKL